MTITKLTTDGPEWTLYKIDMSDNVNGFLTITALGILKPLDAKLYLKLNDTGSGEMSFPLTSSMASLLGIGNFISLDYRGAYRGGFFVETRELVEANSSEYSGLAIKVSGRGPLALLDDAIVWDWWTPGIENTRKFGILNVMPDGGHQVPAGEILFKLLDEAQNYKTNPAGQHLTRYCWRTGELWDVGAPIGEPLLTWDFTDTVDSTPAPAGPIAWPDLEDMEFRVGTSLLDVQRQIAALRPPLHPTWSYDFTITKEIPTSTTGLFVLHAYSGGIGADLSSTIIFRVGMNCMEVSRKFMGADVRNVILVEFSDPAVPYTHVSDSAYILPFRRRESMLQASNASLLATAINYGNAELAVTKKVGRDIALKITDAVAPHLFLDFNLGDTIKYDSSYSTASYRAMGAQLSWTGDQPYADIVVEIDQ